MDSQCSKPVISDKVNLRCVHLKMARQEGGWWFLSTRGCVIRQSCLVTSYPLCLLHAIILSMILSDPSGLFMGKIFHLRDLHYINITFALLFSTGKMMNILSDFGKDEQVKTVALKTGISGKNSAISSLQIIIFLVPLVILIIINSFFPIFRGKCLIFKQVNFVTPGMIEGANNNPLELRHAQ